MVPLTIVLVPLKLALNYSVLKNVTQWTYHSLTTEEYIQSRLQQRDVKSIPEVPEFYLLVTDSMSGLCLLFVALLFPHCQLYHIWWTCCSPAQIITWHGFTGTVRIEKVRGFQPYPLYLRIIDIHHLRGNTCIRLYLATFEPDHC